MSWKSVIDVTGDKKILKKIKKAGEGFDRPNEGSQVKSIHYISHKHGDMSHVGMISKSYEKFEGWLSLINVLNCFILWQ